MRDIDIAQIRRLDMSLLLVFSELIRHRKMTVVAERLGLTQSAISHSLRRLRDLFADELFLRRPNGLEPTGRALMLEPKVASILALSADALSLDETFNPRNDSRTVRIAALDYEQAMFVAPLVGGLRQEAPRTRLIFRSLSRKAALDALGTAEIDLAIGYFPQVGGEYGLQVLYQENYSVVMRRHHPLGQAKLTPKRYCGAEHLLVSIGGDLSGIVDQTLVALGFERRVVAAVPLFLPALATVSRTDLVCTVPSRLAERYAASHRLIVRSPPVTIRSFAVHMIWHRRTANEPALKWIRQQFATIIAREVSGERASPRRVTSGRKPTLRRTVLR
jgi:DNA-binding transcriptional LysR family regulator